METSIQRGSSLKFLFSCSSSLALSITKPRAYCALCLLCMVGKLAGGESLALAVALVFEVNQKWICYRYSGLP